jgi:hypothetical protein
VLTRLDWITVCAPIVLAVLGMWISVRPPSRKFHFLWLLVFILLGGAAAATTLIQIRQARRADEATRISAKTSEDALQATITGLKNQVTGLSEKSIPTLIGDVNDLKPHKAPAPNLTLRFVYPADVAIVVDNARGAGLADRPAYGAQLLDLDNIEGDYLKIPTQVGDFIRSGDSLGPTQFMGLPAVKAIVKSGDRIFGSVYVSCPTCVKTRGYWLFIEVGEGGWYEEQSDPWKTIGSRKAAETLAGNFDTYSAVLAPPSKRIPVKQTLDSPK